MWFQRSLVLSPCIIAGTPTAFADQPVLDCSKKPLAGAVSAAATGASVTFKGICTGPVFVRAGALTLTGVGTAVINGNGHEALTVAGVRGVTFSNMEVRNAS